MICDLIDWAIANNWYVVLYTNRKLLIEQLSKVLAKRGLDFGVRASGHEDMRELPVQISSLPTEHSRVLRSKKWEVHGAGSRTLAIVDECHLNSSNTASQILQKHLDAGGAYVGFTATPMDLGHLYDSLLVAGTPSELRKCGALVPAYHFGPDEPDLRNFKPNVKTGEYSENDLRKAVMTKCIFARVLEWYQKINADQRPTILFGPGVPESIWFAEQFLYPDRRQKELRHIPPISAAHIDGEGVWENGEFRRASTDEREAVLDRVRSGDIKVLCNRFVLREGLDLPQVSHVILATVMGLRTYLQSCGRALRACEGKNKATLQDHGGHWHRHGSVNMDRQWTLEGTESSIRNSREETFRAKKAPEPIHCPQCGLIRMAGPKCPKCGFEAAKRSRLVIQMDGALREHEGDIYKPRETKKADDTESLWKKAYWRARNSGRTFRQARGLFFHEEGYWPPENLPLMPIDPLDWTRKIKDVPMHTLIGFMPKQHEPEPSMWERGNE
jgi:superfamily II DNA or RNA helicase